MTTAPVRLPPEYRALLEENGFTERWSERAWNNPDFQGHNINVTFWSSHLGWSMTFRAYTMRLAGTTVEQLRSVLDSIRVGSCRG